jgi:hypothetical protein
VQSEGNTSWTDMITDCPSIYRETRADFSSILADQATFAKSLRQLQNNKVNSTYLRYVSRRFSDPTARYHANKKRSIIRLYPCKRAMERSCMSNVHFRNQGYFIPSALTVYPKSVKKSILRSYKPIKYRRVSFILVQFSPR